MEIFLVILQVIFGGLIIFTVSMKSYLNFGQNNPNRWVLIVGALALANMLIHRFIGSPFSTPFYTAMLFLVTLLGLDKQIGIPPVVIRRALYALGIGVLIGWLSFAEIQ